MDTLPNELLFNISLYLPPCYLSTINKLFSTIYDEYYYKKYLQSKYFNTNFNNKLTYKELCQSSLEEGDLHHLNIDNNIITNYDIKGIKFTLPSVHIHNIPNLYLNFNKDLYSFNNITKELTLIDTNVTDIAYASYIKDNNWYRFSYGYEKILIHKGNENFIKIDYSGYYGYSMCACTNYELYLYNSLDQRLLCKKFDNRIINISVNNSIITILFENNDLIHYRDYILDEIKTISDVNKLLPFCYKKGNDNYLFYIKHENNNIFYIKKDAIKIKSYIIPKYIGQEINNIVRSSSIIYLFTNRGIFTYNIINKKYSQILSEIKIKNICSTISDFYFIK